ncbi:hypothetical protein J7643_18195 [bacterium]|nr:hypothetical protein [bacterium]
MKQLSQATLLAASLLMVGCADLKPPASMAPTATVAATRKLVLVPRLVDGGYAASSVVARHTSQSIDHLVIKLFTVGQDAETPVLGAGGTPVQVDLGRDELSNPITISELHANKTYRVRAYAYRAAGTNVADLISDPEGSYVDVTVTTDDRPAMAQLKVTLTDVPFSGTATSNGVTVLDGGYSPVAPESITIGRLGTLQPKSSDVPITNTGGGYSEPVRIGNRVYQMGNNNDDNTKVMVADVRPDGSLSTFVEAGVNLTVPRTAYRRAIIGNRLYVFGGYNALTDTFMNTIEAATIQPDGTLGAFQVVNSHLVQPMGSFGLHVGGGKVYVFGGYNHDNGTSTTQVASIGPDGTLGSFVAYPAINLPTAMSGFATVRANQALYLLGNGFGLRNSVLKAPINPDGSLGNFQDTGVTLTIGRDALSGAFIGGKLYAIGGFSPNPGGTPLSSIEAATVNADGSLGAFSVLGGASLTPGEWGHESVIAGNSLYVFTSGHVQRFPIQVPN